MKIPKLFKNKWANHIGYLILSLILLFVGLYFSIYIGLWGKIPTSKDLSNLNQSQATVVLDRNEALIGKLYIYDRQPIDYNQFPQHLIDALIATEDTRFYEHNGIDNKSLARVFFKTLLMSDETSGGGSTITLQLAKNLFGRENYGSFGIIINKIKESIVAKRLEDLYSKQEILNLYLNTVPFPDNTYGIESAAKKFFNVTTSQLTIPQSATLIGTLKANHSYNPRLFPERSKARRDLVIDLMNKQGFISDEEASIATESELELDYHHYAPNQGLAPYFRAEIKKQLDSILQNPDYKNPNGETYNVFRDGLKVYTTLDNTMQRYAEEAMREHMSNLQATYEKAYGKRAPWLKNKAVYEAAKKRLKVYKKLKTSGISEKAINDSLSKPKSLELFSWDGTIMESVSTLDSLEHFLKFLNAGLISLEPSSGAIRAYVGGIDYRFFQYDHVSQSKRQVGSTFKPFVYTAALENGMDPCAYFSVKPVTYTDVDDWTPTNASEIDDEDIDYSLEYALSNSINTIAVKVLYETGIDKTIEQAYKMGIKSTIENVPSIALGSANLSLLEMASAYSSFVNSSMPSTPIFITKIEDKNGNIIASFEDLNPKINQEKAFSDETRQTMLEFMKATVNSGTAQRLRTSYKLNNNIAGKTGTTQDNKDGWFAAIMPNLVTVVWVGNDNQQIGFSSTSIGQGANSALPIFAKYLQKLNNDSKFRTITHAEFETPRDDVLNNLDCEQSKKESFLERLFRSDSDSKEFRKKRKGIFDWLKKKKEDNSDSRFNP
ncbi:transglycosylase domain-containing protein [Geojedonia litorea]|uniref:Transglycosylase domain-containing protein n=1 Tax=Geojedonia litorea TaxID=1268269 RepID=A0ABV9N0M0_9FLAO